MAPPTPNAKPSPLPTPAARSVRDEIAPPPAPATAEDDDMGVTASALAGAKGPQVVPNLLTPQRPYSTVLHNGVQVLGDRDMGAYGHFHRASPPLAPGYRLVLRFVEDGTLRWEAYKVAPEKLTPEERALAGHVRQGPAR